MVLVLLFLTVEACGRVTPTVQPPPPVPVPEVLAKEPDTPKQLAITEFVIEPAVIEPGQYAVLSWSVHDAAEIEISPGIGKVDGRGRQRITPSSSTLYTLSAKGEAGSATASALINVIALPASAVTADSVVGSLSDGLGQDLIDVYFDYDRSNLRPQGQAILLRNAAALKAVLRDFSIARIVIEGHCDERGSAEYNLALGDKRASSVSAYLVQLGLPAGRVTIISYGKERPQCTDFGEECFHKNRRVHFVVSGQGNAAPL
jgi:peptidoglycan-associated lipoprotein